MHDWSTTKRWIRGARDAVGLGLLAGSLEMLGHAASMKLSLGYGRFLALSAIALLAMGAVGGLAGLVTGVVHLRPSDPMHRARPLAWQVGLASVLISGWYLWDAAGTMQASGRPAAAITMALMPLAFGGVIYFNAGFWYRKAELGASFRLGWLPIAALGAFVVVQLSALLHTVRDTGGTGALEGDPNVLLITVDELPRSEVFGGPLQVETEGAARFTEAVSPLPDAVPAAATIHTALHPLRHGVLRASDALRPGFTTLAERLEREGWATGAFVSDSALGRTSGLDQGFRTYDAASGVPGLASLTIARRVGYGEGSRSNAETADRFAVWFDRHVGVPVFAWVHLRGPDVLRDLQRIEGEIGAAGLESTTLIVVVGTKGRGETGLADPLVVVPLWIRAPGLKAKSLDVDAQVRLMDVAPTVLDYLKLDPMEPSEGVDLLGYAEGVRKQSLSTSLVGRSGPDLFDSVLLGVRNNGLKYVREVRTGTEHLYDLATDPGEENDLAATHTTTLERARGLVQPEEAALRGLLREGR